MISQTAKYYIGGLLKHANALMAFCAPSTSSYKRLVPGYKAPVNLVYSLSNCPPQSESRCIRRTLKQNGSSSGLLIPMCNPYLSFSALLMAGIDGVRKKIDPGQPFEGNTYELEGKVAKSSRPSPAHLRRQSTLWKQTTSSCSKEGSSPRTSSTFGSSINGLRSTLSVSAPTRGSFTSTSICNYTHLFSSSSFFDRKPMQNSLSEISFRQARTCLYFPPPPG